MAAQALADGADTLITTGGIQSNHARATASVAARLGLGCVLVANGTPPDKPTANALLDRLLGADVRYVGSREARAPGDGGRRRGAQEQRPPAVRHSARRLHALGAAAYAMAVTELLAQIPAPDLIVLSTSSGGTQAGLIAGCRAARFADARSSGSAPTIRRRRSPARSGASWAASRRSSACRAARSTDAPIEVDDRFVGERLRRPDAAVDRSDRAVRAARGAVSRPDLHGEGDGRSHREGRAPNELGAGTTLFWHTGGQVGLFA